jgi:hypothetical protein
MLPWPVKYVVYDLALGFRRACIAALASNVLLAALKSIFVDVLVSTAVAALFTLVGGMRVSTFGV